jgi:hypothetical protein
MAAHQVNITDRAHRYRANKLAPVKGKKCLLCGSTKNLVPDHWDGHPDHTNPANLEVLCKSCNTSKGAAFAKVGRGRLTNQYNPTKGGGAANVGEWMQAVGAITPHTDRGDRGISTTMSTRDAVDMIRATPQSKRRDFAAKLGRHNPATRQNLFGFGAKPAPVTRKRRGGLTLSEAASAATKAGRKSRDMSDFDGWLESKHLADRSDGFVSRVRDSYKRGVDAAEADDRNGEYLKSLPKGGNRGGSVTFKGRAIKPTESGAWVVPSIDKESEFDTVQDAKAFITSWKRNPAGGYAIGNMRGQTLGSFKSQAEAFKEARSLAASGQRVEVVWKAKSGSRGVSGGYKSKWFGPKRNPSGSTGAAYSRRFASKAKAVAFAEAHQLHLGQYSTPPTIKETKRGFVVSWKFTGKKNPASASAEVFEDFHGFKPSEVVTVTKHIHHHEHLAAAGVLTHLDVWGVDDKGHQISGFKGAFLAFNESKNQLFVEGGDQSVNLEDFGIDSPHELETLGRVTDIGYQTNKTHLGDEGGEAVYVHKFRTTNDNGKHVVVKIARYPDLIYDVRNEQLLFSGGSYEILREGINK